jgi:Skp family chaperone for outer membrane proteins
MTNKKSFFLLYFIYIISLNKTVTQDAAGAKKATKGSAITVSHEPQVQVITTVNRDKLITESQYMQAKKKEMEDLDKQLYDEIVPMIQELQTKQVELEKQKKTLSQEALEKAEKALADLYVAIQGKSQKGQEQIKMLEMQMLKEFGEQVQQATEEYLKLEKNSNMLLIPSDSSIYVHEKYDATKDILTLMDTNFSFSKNKNAATKEVKESKTNKEQTGNQQKSQQKKMVL